MDKGFFCRHCGASSERLFLVYRDEAAVGQELDPKGRYTLGEEYNCNQCGWYNQRIEARGWMAKPNRFYCGGMFSAFIRLRQEMLRYDWTKE